MVTPDSTVGSTADSTAARQRYRRLPEPVHLEDTVESQPSEDARDPENDRNTDRDFMLRYAGF